MIGSWVGGLVDPHLHPHSHIMSLTESHIILYLSISTTAGSRVGRFQDFISLVLWATFCTWMIWNLHFDQFIPRDPKYLIPPMLILTDHITTVSQFLTFCNNEFTSSRVGRLKKVPNVICFCPSPPPSCYSQEAFSMV